MERRESTRTVRRNFCHCVDAGQNGGWVGEGEGRTVDLNPLPTPTHTHTHAHPTLTPHPTLVPAAPRKKTFYRPLEKLGDIGHCGEYRQVCGWLDRQLGIKRNVIVILEGQVW